MDSLVALQIVIPVETLRALVAFKGPVVGRRLMRWLLSTVHVLRVARGVPAVEAGNYAVRHAAHQVKRTPRIVHV